MSCDVSREADNKRQCTKPELKLVAQHGAYSRTVGFTVRR
jgi:hypothetical protein